MNIDLNNFCPLAIADVRDSKRDFDLSADGERARGQFWSAILEGRIRKAVSEWEQRSNASAVIVPIPNIQIFSI